jgi:hypothetical protein
LREDGGTAFRLGASFVLATQHRPSDMLDTTLADQAKDGPSAADLDIVRVRPDGDDAERPVLREGESQHERLIPGL